MNSFKSVIEKPLSPIRSESAMIDDDNEIDTITTKIYKLPLPTNKPKTNKSISKKGSQSKSLEKKSMISSTFLEKKEKPSTTSVTNTSVAKQTHQTSLNKSHRSITKKQEQSLSRIITTIPRSKYERRKWDEPYIGRRLDPPTPSPSPSLFVWPQDSDPDENDVPYEQNSTNERFL
jgi:hypothetical protein